MPKKITLDNGIRIILNPMPHMASVATGIWVGTGSRNEDKSISGISHFLEHMVFKGTQKRSSRRIKEDIEGRGGSLNAFTSEEVTCFLTKTGSSLVDTSLDVLSDIALSAKLDKEDIDRERTVIMEEIRMYRDLPNHHVYDLLSEVMWPNHPLGLSIAGSIESVSPIVRKDFLDYRSKNYTPSNIVVALSGNLKEEKVLQKINKLFNIEKETKSTVPIKFNNTQSNPRVNFLDKDTAQSHLLIGMHSFGKTHKDKYALSLLHIILGANMSSRLFESVREKKGLAYEIRSEVKRYKDVGAFLVRVGTERKKVKEAVSLIIKELKKIKEEAVPLKELNRAKEFFKEQLLLAIEDTMDNMLWLGESVTSLNKVPDKDEIIKKVNSISSEDLKRVAKIIFTNKGINLALIGSIKDKEIKELEKELSLL